MANRFPALIIAALAVFVAGCSEREPKREAADSGPASSGKLVTEAESDLRAELLQADRDFARRVSQGRLEGWVDAFAVDGAVLPADGPIATGKEAIRDLFAPLFAEPGFEMTWQPVSARVATSGDLGYTFGTWRTTRTGVGGEVIEADEGKYVTVWRRAEDGRWRVALDIGNKQPQAQSFD